VFKKIKLSSKIAILASVLLVLAGILGIVASINMSSASRTSNVISRETSPSIAVAIPLSEAIVRFSLNFTVFSYSSDPAYSQRLYQRLDEADELIKNAKQLLDVAYLPNLQSFVSEKEPAIKSIREQAAVLFELAENQRRISENTFRVGTNLGETLRSVRDSMINDQNSGTSALTDRNLTLDLIFDLLNARIAYNVLIQSIDTVGAGTLTSNIRRSLAIFDNIYASPTLDPKFKREFSNLRASFTEYIRGIEEWARLQGQRHTVRGGIERIIADLDRSAEVLTTNTIGRIQNESRDAAKALNTSTMITVGLLIISVILGIILSVIITKSIVTPISNAIKGLADGSHQVSLASGEIATTSQGMASGASEQAANLEEISASLNEITSMIHSTSKNMEELKSKAEGDIETANNNKNEMGKLKNAVMEIQNSSNETAKILKDIDDIAFQTNLLALNAAVEAARAGEAGKGFAVVAEEVRNLAQRSAESAKKTAQMIENSQNSCAIGVQLVNKVEEAIYKTADLSVDALNTIVEISNAAEEESKGVSQVNSAIGSLDQVTQSNASSSEELAASSEELSSQASGMNDLVNELVAIVDGEEAMSKQKNMIDAPRHRTQVGYSTSSSKKQMSNREMLIPFSGDEEEYQ